MRDEQVQAYAHVIWIGGSPCAGKTTIADTLAAKYHGNVYHFDRMEMRHIARSDEATNPDLMAFLALDMDQRWLTRSPDEMARNAIASWQARFPLVLEDLRAFPTDAPIFAEGPGLFPGCVAPLLSTPQQAVWLVTSERLCAAVRQQRKQRGGFALETSDPDLALRNIVRRDLLMAAYVQREAEALHLTCHVVDESRSLARTIALAEQHIAPHLGAR
ncbi:MAG: zeta toxin family protein [Nitrososphaerota archaeon]